jgi:flagellar biosynthesis GTPase FlhF
MESTDRGEIIEEIALRTGLTVEEIEGVITFEIKEAVDEESGKVTICHVPSGNPRKAHTITIDRAALERHLAHGDFVGECDDDFDKKLQEREAKLAEKEARLAEKQEERETRLAQKLAEIEERRTENVEEHQARLAEKQDQALQRAEEIIQRLEQRIAQLEQRLQTMLERVESGEYFGRTVGENLVTNTYSISFDGTATSLFDESVTADISGEIFLKSFFLV